MHKTEYAVCTGVRDVNVFTKPTLDREIWGGIPYLQCKVKNFPEVFLRVTSISYPQRGDICCSFIDF